MPLSKGLIGFIDIRSTAFFSFEMTIYALVYLYNYTVSFFLFIRYQTSLKIKTHLTFFISNGVLFPFDVLYSDT